MTDTMTPEQRHYCMAQIHSKGTKPEMKVRKWLWSRGYRYRLNVKSVPGKPDIVMRRYRTAIFVNGCFWHGHGVVELKTGKENSKELRKKMINSDCCKIPSTNREFWENKIRRNRERDRENYHVLRENGWNVIVVWECQLKPKSLERTMLDVEMQLNENMLAMYKRRKVRAYTNEDESPMPMAAEETT